VQHVLQLSEEVAEFISANHPSLKASLRDVVREIAVNHVAFSSFAINLKMDVAPLGEPGKGFGGADVMNLVDHIKMPSDPLDYSKVEWRDQFDVFNFDLRYSQNFAFFHSKRQTANSLAFKLPQIAADSAFPVVFTSRTIAGYDDESPHFQGNLRMGGSALDSSTFLSFEKVDFLFLFLLCLSKTPLV
jgi:hypothetical protein